MPDTLFHRAGPSAPLPSLEATLGQLARELPAYRLPIGDELRLHRALEQVLPLVLPGEAIVREYTLARRDTPSDRVNAPGRIDFYLPRLRLGVEVKVKGGPSGVLRQLQRYLTSPDIAHLVLVTSRPYLVTLSRPLTGQPFTVVRLLEAHL